ncbi:DUF5330 domain-containing protein [Mesorhizobium sp. RMAD-H1]|uniref:DUF5330 domain-containing protein n=1 Tax=Mesorhizobium sp. RMAD-H1 TaxID=2587065 RepID=UPI001621D7CA|nr:DUF5330 domain-containing protein [Mesorhizobium sp. RMAD-H1]MBB2970125.1 hypothetical protein [Mesorhizobium sp. RMAD-H1]
MTAAEPFRPMADAYADETLRNQFKFESNSLSAFNRIFLSVCHGRSIKAVHCKRPEHKRDGSMRFLIKMAFWLTLAFVVLPHTPLADLAIRTGEQDSTRPSSAETVVRDSGSEEGPETAGSLDTLFAAQKTLADVSDFCTRNPSICETGKSVFSSLGLQAKDGAHIVHEYLNAPSGGQTAASSISSKIEALQVKMPEMPKNGESISIPVPTSREAVTGKMDALHTGTVKHGN